VHRRHLLISLTTTLLPATMHAAEPGRAPLVQTLSAPGELPLLLTVPHDGEAFIGLTPARTQGTLLRDLGTRPLAEQTAQALARLTGGQRPALVVALAHRKFVDVNRSEAEGTESSDAAQAWRSYHAEVAAQVADLRKRFPNGALMVDVHGQGQVPDTLFRGTRNGQTARALVQRLGPAALQGPRSLMGELAARGYTVAPAVQDTLSAEDPRFSGGHTVATYGSHQPDGIDAIQLEVGSALRQRQARLPDDLAAALLAFMRYAGYLPANAQAPGA